MKHLPQLEGMVEGALLDKGYQGQYLTSAHNSAMNMQNKQIRQPGSQAEPLRSSGNALDTGQRQSLIKAAGQH